MDEPLCTHYTGGACGVNLLTEELGIQVEVVIGPAQILYPFRLLNLLKSCRPTLKLYAILAGVNYPLTGVPSLYCYTAKLKKKRNKRKRVRRTPSLVPFPKKPSNLSRLYKKKRCFGSLGLFSQWPEPDKRSGRGSRS